MNEIVKVDESINQITEKTIKDYLFSSSTKLSDQEQLLFLNMSKEFRLNPFKREIYAIKFTSKRKDGSTYQTLQIVTGYQTYISRADKTGKLNGWSVEFSEDGEVATLVVNRKDWEFPFKWDVYKSEVSKNNKIWKEMPKFMMKKVAIAQGFRMCFPNEFSGMPYISDELKNLSEDDIKEAKKFDENKAEIDRVLHLENLIKKSGSNKIEVANYYNVESLSEFDKENIEKLIKIFTKRVEKKAVA